MYVPPSYQGYDFPAYSRALGWMIGLLPAVPIPVTMVYKIINTPGTLSEVLEISAYVLHYTHYYIQAHIHILTLITTHMLTYIYTRTHTKSL